MTSIKASGNGMVCRPIQTSPENNGVVWKLLHGNLGTLGGFEGKSWHLKND